MFFDQAKDLFWILIRNQPHRDLGLRPGRNDRLAPLPLIAAGQSVDLEGWTRRAPFVRSETSLAGKLRNAEQFAKFLLVERNSRQLLFLESGQGFNVEINGLTS